jgi:hypothetical protein
VSAARLREFGFREPKQQWKCEALCERLFSIAMPNTSTVLRIEPALSRSSNLTITRQTNVHEWQLSNFAIRNVT